MTGEFTGDKTAADDCENRLSLNQTARLLGVSSSTVINWHKNGTLRDVVVTPLGRLFDPEEVERLMIQREHIREGRM